MEPRRLITACTKARHLSCLIITVTVICKITVYFTLSTNFLQGGRSQVRFPIESLEIFHRLNPSGRNMTISVDSAPNRNECQGSSLEDKGSRRLGLTTLPTICVDCLKIQGAPISWNLRWISRPVQGQLYLLSTNFVTMKFTLPLRLNVEQLQWRA